MAAMCVSVSLGFLPALAFGTRHWAKTEKGVKYLCGSRR